MAFDLEGATHEGNPFSDACQAKRIPFFQCFLYMKTNSVIFNLQSKYSIGSCGRKVYMRSHGMLSDVVTAFLDEAVNDDFDFLGEVM